MHCFRQKQLLGSEVASSLLTYVECGKNGANSRRGKTRGHTVTLRCALMQAPILVLDSERERNPSYAAPTRRQRPRARARVRAREISVRVLRTWRDTAIADRTGHARQNVPNPAPYTLHPTPYTLHRDPTPNTLLPTPYSLLPKPYIVNPKPAELCKEKGVKGFPTWEINGKMYPGEKSLADLAKLSNFSPPSK